MHLQGFDYADPANVYFATIRARRGLPPFVDRRLAADIVIALLRLRTIGRVRLYAYVLMPDHLHIVLSTREGMPPLPVTVARFKSYTTRLAWERGIVGALWQRDFYEHVIRGEKGLVATCEYVLANPVRAGLARSLEEWPYSATIDPLPL